MLNMRMTSLSLAAVAGLAASAAIFPGTALAYQCKSFPTQAVGVHKLKVVAHAKAPKNWQASVKSQFGLSWSVWSTAKSKSITCNHQPGRWICLASAKPCNYVVK